MAGQTVVVSVLADTKPMAKAFKGLGNEMGLGKLGTAARKVGKGIAVAAGTVAAAGVAVLGKALHSGFKRLNNIDQATAKLRGLGHEAKAVDGIMADALASVKGTAFGLDEAATTAAGAVAAGIAPGKELERILKITGDTATIAGSSMGEMGSIFNKVAANSKLSMGEVNQLADRGVPIMQFLADQYGVTAEEARKMVSDGKVSFEDFAQALEENIGGAALESGNTVAGAWANMQAALGRVGAQLLGGIFPQLAGGFGNITGALDSLGPVAERVGEWVGTKLAAAMATLGEWVTGTALPALRDLGDWFMAEGLPRLQAFGAFLRDEVLPRLAELGAWVRDEVLPPLLEFGTYLAVNIVPWLQQLGEWVQSNTAWLGPLAAAILGAVAALKAIQIAMAAWQVITTAVTAAQALLNAVMLANPIGLVIVAVGALVGAFLYLWNTNEGFRKAMQNAWATIVSAVKSAWAWLSGLPGRFSAMMGSITRAVSAGITAVVGFFAGLPGRAFSAAASLVQRVGSLARSAMSAGRSAISAGISTLLGLFRQLPSRILGALGNLGGTLANAGRQLIDGFIGSIRGGFDRVRGAFSGLTDMIPSWKGPPARDRTLLRGAGRMILQGLVRGLGDEMGTVKRVLGTVTKTVAATELPPLRAPGLAIEHQAVATSAGRRAGTGRHYHITLQTLDPSPEAGRVIVQAIHDYERMNGRTW